MKGVILSVLLAMAVVSLMTTGPAEAITCLDVVEGLPAPGSACCSSVRGLVHVAPADRRTVCNCIKQAASRVPGIKDENVKSLPGQCGTPLPFPMGLTFDCTKIR